MQTATIIGGETKSNAISLFGAKDVGIVFPSSWDGTAIAFEVAGKDYVFNGLYDDAGNAVTAVVAADTNVALNTAAAKLAPWSAFRIVSGTLAVPAAQPGTTAPAGVVDFGDDKTLTITSGVKGTSADGITFAFEMNTEDALAASDEDRTVTVKLADTTASKNTAAAIQAAIRAVETVDSVDVSALTVAASTEYAAAPPTGGQAGAVVTVATGKTLTFLYPSGGTDGNGLTISVENNVEDALSVTNPEGTTEILVKLATDTDSKNAASAIETAVQALTVIGDYDVTAMTVDGNAAYDAAPPVGVKAVQTTTLLDSEDASMGALVGTAGVVGPEGNTVLNLMLGSITANSEDVLSVTALTPFEGYPVASILLANATASNNTAEKILVALKALVPTGTDYDDYITGMTLTADSTWAASPPVTAPATIDQTLGTQTLGVLPVAEPQQTVTALGTDVPDAEAILAGGVDCNVRVSLRQP